MDHWHLTRPGYDSYHPSHAASKIPSKVDTDIRQAIISNPHLKTRDIMTGKIMHVQCIGYDIIILF